MDEIIRFHGGCSGCTQQVENEVDFCYDCQYFNGEWYKPSLNNRPETKAERVRRQVIDRKERE